jgi:hypothetical protein
MLAQMITCVLNYMVFALSEDNKFSFVLSSHKKAAAVIAAAFFIIL